MKVLGIESSCDETGVAVYCSEKGLLGHKVNSQIDLFTEYGGVIPEIAARDHSVKIIKLLEKLLSELNLSLENIDLIAYTVGPGLIGSLMVGETVPKTIAKTKNIEILPIHHLEGHILAPGLEDKDVPPPYLCLLVSGGHTQIVKVENYNEMEIIGTTLDDAAGEAFDKSAKVLGLKYPGGPLIDKYAKNGFLKWLSSIIYIFIITIISYTMMYLIFGFGGSMKIS